ncbi:MAG: hypothetical protein R3A52_06615 [Polyangiales bacterium]
MPPRSESAPSPPPPRSDSSDWSIRCASGRSSRRTLSASATSAATDAGTAGS